MKKILLLFAFTSLKIIVIAQFIPPPNFDFSGTKLRWVHQAKNHRELIKNGFIDNREVLTTQTAQIIHQDYVYYLLDDLDRPIQGSTLLCLDLDKGNLRWQRDFNPIEDKQKYGYSYQQTQLNFINDSIELIGTTKIDTSFVVGGPKYVIGGFANKRYISKEYGSDISNQTYNDPWKRSCLSTPVVSKIDNKEFSHFYYCNNDYTNFNTGEDFYNLIPYNLDYKLEPIQSNDTSKWIIFKDFNLQGKSTFGPYKIAEDVYAYFLTLERLIGRVYSYEHFFWTINSNGDISNFSNITALINSTHKSTIFYRVEYISQNDYFRIFTNSPNHDRGLIYLTKNAELIKNQEDLQIENKYISHLVSKELNNQEGIIHVLRFQTEKDIHIYKEINGNFSRIGHLKQNDSYIYDYIPQYLTLSENNDPIISLTTLLDTIILNSPPLEYGGFNFICKIDAKELGLNTSIDEKNKTNILFHFSPNPTSQSFYFHTPTHGQLEILDPSGKIVLHDKIVQEHNNIDISAFISGIYFIKFISFDGKIQVEKLIVNKL